MFRGRRNRRNRGRFPPPGEAAEAAPAADEQSLQENPIDVMSQLMKRIAFDDMQNAPPNIELPGDPLYYPLPQAVTFDFLNAGTHMKVLRQKLGLPEYTESQSAVAEPQLLRLPRPIGVNLIKALKEEPIAEPFDKILIGLSNRLGEEIDFGAKTQAAMRDYPTEVTFKPAEVRGEPAAAAPAPADPAP